MHRVRILTQDPHEAQARLSQSSVTIQRSVLSAHVRDVLSLRVWTAGCGRFSVSLQIESRAIPTFSPG